MCERICAIPRARGKKKKKKKNVTEHYHTEILRNAMIVDADCFMTNFECCQMMRDNF